MQTKNFSFRLLAFVALVALGLTAPLEVQAIDVGSIAAIKYEDVNGNGKQDYSAPKEPRLNGWEMTLSDDQDNVMATGTTGADGTGRVEFHDLLPGTYTVCETLQAGWFNTEPGDGCRTVRVSSGNQNSARFGNALTGKVRVNKYEDLNLDGKRNFGGSKEPGLANWEFALYDDSGIQVGSSQQTGPTGWTTFKAITPGDYTICEQLQPGWASSDLDHGNAYAEEPGEVCKDVTVGIGETVKNFRFGNYRDRGMECFEVNFMTVRDKRTCDNIYISGNLKLADDTAFDPEIDDVTVTMNDEEITIPKGRFEENHSQNYFFNGMIPDVGYVYMSLNFDTCSWWIYTSCKDVDGLISSDDVTVGLEIGTISGYDSFDWAYKGNSFAMFTERSPISCCSIRR